MQYKTTVSAMKAGHKSDTCANSSTVDAATYHISSAFNELITQQQQDKTSGCGQHTAFYIVEVTTIDNKPESGIDDIDLLEAERMSNELRNI